VPTFRYNYAIVDTAKQICWQRYRLRLLQRVDLKLSGDLWQCFQNLGGDIDHSVRVLVADLVAHEIADPGQPSGWHFSGHAACCAFKHRLDCWCCRNAHWFPLTSIPQCSQVVEGTSLIQLA
jgi:hypothetical protein